MNPVRKLRPHELDDPAALEAALREAVRRNDHTLAALAATHLVELGHWQPVWQTLHRIASPDTHPDPTLLTLVSILTEALSPPPEAPLWQRFDTHRLPSNPVHFYWRALCAWRTDTGDALDWLRAHLPDLDAPRQQFPPRRELRLLLHRRPDAPSGTAEQAQLRLGARGELRLVPVPGAPAAARRPSLEDFHAPRLPRLGSEPPPPPPEPTTTPQPLPATHIISLPSREEVAAAQAQARSHLLTPRIDAPHDHLPTPPPFEKPPVRTQGHARHIALTAGGSLVGAFIGAAISMAWLPSLFILITGTCAIGTAVALWLLPFPADWGA